MGQRRCAIGWANLPIQSRAGRLLNASLVPHRINLEASFESLHPASLATMPFFVDETRLPFTLSDHPPQLSLLCHPTLADIRFAFP